MNILNNNIFSGAMVNKLIVQRARYIQSIDRLDASLLNGIQDENRVGFVMWGLNGTLPFLQTLDETINVKVGLLNQFPRPVLPVDQQMQDITYVSNAIDTMLRNIEEICDVLEQ